MRREDKLLFFGFFIFIIILSIVSVNAGWFKDLFQIGEDRQDLEGELPANVPASVTLANAPPIIIAYLAPTDVTAANAQTHFGHL